jgi:hypothetical protein
MVGRLSAFRLVRWCGASLFGGSFASDMLLSELPTFVKVHLCLPNYIIQQKERKFINRMNLYFHHLVGRQGTQA